MSVIALAGTLVFTLINFFKFLTNKDWNAALTQVTVWFAGVLVIGLLAHSDFAANITLIGDQPLNAYNGASLIFVGLMASSLLSAANEVKKAIDSDDSAKKPPLLP